MKRILSDREAAFRHHRLGPSAQLLSDGGASDEDEDEDVDHGPNMFEGPSAFPAKVRSLVCGGVPMDDPNLRLMLRGQYRQALKLLREKGRIPIGRSRVMFGVLDPTGTLKEHEVC